jgi:hypothetical protein
MSIERKARVLNGSIVVVACLLTLLFDDRFAWLALFMGASLIFSGVTDFCGFAVILGRLQDREVNGG